MKKTNRLTPPHAMKVVRKIEVMDMKSAAELRKELSTNPTEEHILFMLDRILRKLEELEEQINEAAK